MNLYKKNLVQKPYQFFVEAIDGHFLVFGFVTHETIPLEIEFKVTIVTNLQCSQSYQNPFEFLILGLL